MRSSDFNHGNAAFIHELPVIPADGSKAPISETATSTAQRASSPLLLRLCGILPWGRFGVAYRCGMLLLAAGLVATLVWQFVDERSQTLSTADCPIGVCMHFDYLSDLVLVVGSLLGLLAMHTLGSLRLLGGPRALLPRHARQHDVVWKWSRATSWQSLYLAILWASSVACRAFAMALDPRPHAEVRACVFTLASLLFVALVFGVLHVSCLICILIDSYAMNVQESMDLAKCLQEWDRLGALIRKVCRAVERGFLLVQTTALILLLYSFTVFMIVRAQPIWWVASNILLAQSLVLLFFKAAEVTELCKRVPSVINSLDFQGNSFSQERHYLVEHITYSAAGFYVGDVRLTAAMVLRLLHFSILGACSAVVKFTMI